MKKFITCIAVGISLLTFCAKADIDPSLDMEKYPVNVSITDAYCSPFQAPKATQVIGKVSSEPDLPEGKYSIKFEIPRNEDTQYYDLSCLKIKVNVDYDVYVDPPLGGVHDLDYGNTKEITVYSPLTSEKKIYVIIAKKIRS